MSPVHHSIFRFENRTTKRIWSPFHLLTSMWFCLIILVPSLRALNPHLSSIDRLLCLEPAIGPHLGGKGIGLLDLGFAPKLLAHSQHQHVLTQDGIGGSAATSLVGVGMQVFSGKQWTGEAMTHSEWCGHTLGFGNENRVPLRQCFRRTPKNSAPSGPTATSTRSIVMLPQLGQNILATPCSLVTWKQAWQRSAHRLSLCTE